MYAPYAPLHVDRTSLGRWSTSDLQSSNDVGFQYWADDYDVQVKEIIIIIMTTTIFIVLSSTVPAICESSLWFIWAKVGQRQVAANS